VTRLLRRVVALLVALVAPATAQDCPPRTEGEDGKPQSSHSLEGTIGDAKVRMYLEHNGEVVAGVYYYTRHWKPLLLSGNWAEGGRVTLTETTRGPASTGQIRGMLGPAGLSGEWISPDDKTHRPVQLRVGGKIDCDGAGPSLSFADPAWPVTFSYPASWHLVREGTSLRLICADPMFMIYDDMDVLISRGVGLTTFEEPGDFVRCHGQWMSSRSEMGAGCNCADITPSCQSATTSTREGMTVLEGGGDSKSYCRAGGYLGLGSRDEYLVLVGERWIQVHGASDAAAIAARVTETMHPRPRAP
jgi:hypothetical protein